MEIAPKRCELTTESLLCNVLNQQANRECHFEVDLSDISDDVITQNSLICEPNGVSDDVENSNRQLVQFLSSLAKRPFKRWGQYHGHITPF